MSTDESNEGIIGFLNKWGVLIGLISGTVAVLTQIGNFIQMVRGDSTLVRTFTIIGILILWIVFFYLYIRKRKKCKNMFEENEPKETRVPFYSPKVRNLALIGLIAIPTGSSVWTYIEYRPLSYFLVLVANFDGPENEKYRITEDIIFKLRGATEKYRREVKIESLNESVTVLQGSEIAKQKGKEHKASMVL
jgi:hypothetical protein